MDFKKINEALVEALDNYNDRNKWESFIQELEENYDYGLHTESHLEIAKFFKYDDLIAIFKECIEYRDQNDGYTIGDGVVEKEYDAFGQLMDRIKQEIPNKEDFELIRSFV